MDSSHHNVLYACFLKKLHKDEIKVAQLSGYCCEQTAYHHGEASLQSTIIKMSHNFIGSYNINLLQPIGQFGTRHSGGDDAASPRYIFTNLDPICRLIFPEMINCCSGGKRMGLSWSLSITFRLYHCC